MTFLVDVNVLSEPTKPAAVQRVTDWLKANRDECVVDAIVMAEVWRGVDALPDGRRKNMLAAWFAELKANIPCLDWTLETAMEWGPLIARVTRAGFTVGIRDTMIEAIAKHHGLTVATRNVNDFTHCGVPVFNPFD